MVRKLLATTALAGILTTGAYAQSTPTPAAGAAPAAETTAPAAAEAVTPAERMGATSDAVETPAGGMAAGEAGSTVAAAPAGAFEYLTALGADQYLSEDLEGATLYASSAADAQEAGEIENFVVGADGTVMAVVVETGDALGDESRQIAIPFGQVDWTMDANNQPRAILTADANTVMAAPTFAGPSADAAATEGTAGMAPAGGTTGMAPTAPATGATPGMDTAQAPTGMTAATATNDMAAATPAAGSSAEGEYIATLGPEQFLSSDLVGRDVYSGPTTDTDNIGEINNVVIGSDGVIQAMIIGVGGFLGIGEKDVGVPFDAIELSTIEGDEAHASLVVTREQLDQAPAFEDGDDDAVNMAATGTAASTAATGAAVGGAAATATDTGATTAASGTGMAANTTAPAGSMAPDSSTTASTGGAPDMSAMTPVTGAEITADNLMGTTVYGPDKQTIGDVGDIAMTADGQVDAIVIDVGGFLGIGAKPVAVAIDNLQFMRDSSGSMFVATQFSQEELQAAPEYDSQTFTQNRDSMRLQSVDAAGGAATSPATAQ